MSASDGCTRDRDIRYTAPSCCHDTLAKLWLFLDHECRPFHREQLRDHLASCDSCRDTYRIAEQFKELLARRCGGERAPDSLHARLRDWIQGGAERPRPTNWRNGRPMAGGHAVVERKLTGGRLDG